MRIDILRNGLAACLILGHITVIFLLFFRLGNYFEVDEIVQIILIISPITGFYATAVVKFYADTAEQPVQTTTINTMFGVISFMLCIAFLFAIFYTIFDFPHGVIRTQESFFLFTMPSGKSAYFACLGDRR
jgi:putative copper export protein